MADPFLWLYDGSGALLTVDNDSGTGPEAAIVYTAASTGSHFVSAAGFGSNTGTFTLGAVDQTGPAGGDVAATIATTRSIAIGKSLTGTIDVPADDDWYQVWLVAGHQYLLYIQGAATNWGTLSSTSLRLIDVNGFTPIASSSAFGGDSSFEFAATQTCYYLDDASTPTTGGANAFPSGAVELPSGSAVPWAALVTA